MNGYQIASGDEDASFVDPQVLWTRYYLAFSEKFLPSGILVEHRSNNYARCFLLDKQSCARDIKRTEKWQQQKWPSLR